MKKTSGQPEFWFLDSLTKEKKSLAQVFLDFFLPKMPSQQKDIVT